MVLPQHTIHLLDKTPYMISSTMETKACTKCGVEKPLSEFYKHRITKDGLTHQCKECNSKRGQAFSKTASGIYTSLKARIKHAKKYRVREVKPFNISRKGFVEWYNNTPKICVYCDLPEEEMWAMQEDFDRRVKRLELDCKNNDLGYVNGNIVLACHRCNFIKNNILTFDEMREFAQKYIKPKWFNKVMKASNSDTPPFYSVSTIR